MKIIYMPPKNTKNFIFFIKLFFIISIFYNFAIADTESKIVATSSLYFKIVIPAYIQFDLQKQRVDSNIKNYIAYIVTDIITDITDSDFDSKVEPTDGTSTLMSKLPIITVQKKRVTVYIL